MIEFIFIASLLTLYTFNAYIDTIFDSVRNGSVSLTSNTETCGDVVPSPSNPIFDIGFARMELIQIVLHQYLNAVLMFAISLYIVYTSEFVMNTFMSPEEPYNFTRYIQDIAPHYGKYFNENNTFIKQTLQALSIGLLLNYILIQALSFIRGSKFEKNKGRVKIEAFAVTVLSFVINLLIYLSL